MTNFFSAPSRGLRPTPSACYPPPPPPNPSNITTRFTITPSVLVDLDTSHVRWYVENLSVPIGEPVAADFTLPTLDGIAPNTVINGEEGECFGISNGPLGSYIGRLHVQWSNNQNRTMTAPYIVHD